MRMIIRNIKPTDIDKLYGKFIASNIRQAEIEDPQKIPRTGFYEYDLSFAAFKARALSPLSLIWEGSGGEVISYAVAYSLNHVRSLQPENQDPVHAEFRSADGAIAYFDQLFLQRGLPAFLAGRMWDAVEVLMRDEKVPGVVAAIPQKPWRNRSATRLAIHRGFSRKSSLDEEKLTLGIFTKPLVVQDIPFR